VRFPGDQTGRDKRHLKKFWHSVFAEVIHERAKSIEKEKDEWEKTTEGGASFGKATRVGARVIRRSRNFRPQSVESWLTKEVYPAALEQRDAYQYDSVRIDYGKELQQAAYLLRSFVPYTQLIVHALRDVEKRDQSAKVGPIKQLVLFGGGPAPEVLGLLQYENAKHPKTTDPFKVCILDRSAPSWRWWYDGFYQRKTCDHFRRTVEIEDREFLIGQRSVQEELSRFADREDVLIVGQNILNEFEEDEGTDFLERALEHVAASRSTQLLLINSTSYSAVARHYDRVCSGQVGGGSLQKIRGKLEESLPEHRPLVPETLHDNLHRDKTHPIRHFGDHSYEYLLVSK